MSTLQPQISLGLPVYNGENFIIAALDSILNQTYPHFELLISDNGSTDGTEEICRHYAARDPRITYQRLPHNIGAAANFNRVFTHTAAPYFKWVAHDDVLAPGFLAACLAILQAEPHTVLAYPRTILIDAQGREFDRYADQLHLQEAAPQRRLAHFFAHPGMCYAIFGLIRSDILRRTALIGAYPRSDRNLIGELALYGRFHELPEYLFCRRVHDQVSTVANTTEYELALWFDPRHQGHRLMPRWRRLSEYVTAIRRAPLTPLERAYCLLQVAQFTLQWQRWAGIFTDIINLTRAKPAPLSQPSHH